MAPADPEARPALDDLIQALRGGRPGALAELLGGVHPADLAEWLQELEPDEAWAAFSALDTESRTEVLQCASDALLEELVPRLQTPELVSVVENMPADEVVDLLAVAEEPVVEEVLAEVDLERARRLRELAHHEADTAGGLMTTEFPYVQTGTRIGDAIKEFKQKDEEVPEDATGIFVVDAEHRPVGYLSGHDLLTNRIHDAVDGVMETDLVTVSPSDDQEDVAHRMLKYGLEAVPVVDGAGVLVGVVTADDLHEVLEEEVEEDILKLVGAAPVDQTRLPVWRRVRQRIPLQLLTVLGGLVTAYILSLALGGGAEGSQSGVELLRYLPIIIGIAGNVGIQCSTILVRAFATGEVQPERELSVLGAEVLTGLCIGILCGASTALVASFMEAGKDGGPQWLFGAAVGSAIAVAVVWAALLGCLVPMVFRRLGIDPAVVAGPFLITLSDVSGAAIFMGVARLVLSGAGGGGA